MTRPRRVPRAQQSRLEVRAIHERNFICLTRAPEYATRPSRKGESGRAPSPSVSYRGGCSNRTRRLRRGSAVACSHRPRSPQAGRGSTGAPGRRTVACALARCGWGGAGENARMGVPAKAAGGDGAVRGGAGEPCHIAGGSQRGRARPASVRGAGLRQVPGMRSAGARLRLGALRELQGRAARRLLVQGPRGVPVLQREAGACDGGASDGAGAAARALPAVDAVLSAPGPVGAAQGRGTALGRRGGESGR